MTRYNNNRFTPGNKANLRTIIDRAYFLQSNNLYNVDDKYLCTCLPPVIKFNNSNQGFNNSMQTENQRISQLLTGTLGGRITFGDNFSPLKLDYLGSREGQPGGSFRPLRNRF